MITVTESAQNHLFNIAKDEGKVPKLSIQGGGCAGFSYKWDLVDDGVLLDGDETIAFDNGGKIYVDGMSLMYLIGSTIDYKTGLFGSLIDIQTPAAASACGCGESINFDMDKVEANYAKFNIPKE